MPVSNDPTPRADNAPSPEDITEGRSTRSGRLEGAADEILAAGARPRPLRRAVREEQSISLPEAVRKLTSLPAEVYGLAGKGRIAAGMDADLTLFDAAKITDHATYTQPLLPNEGIRRVYLGGVCAVRDDQYTGAMAGKLLRRTR